MATAAVPFLALDTVNGSMKFNEWWLFFLVLLTRSFLLKGSLNTPKFLLTFSAHVWCGDPNIHQTTFFVQIHHDLWSHRFCAVTSAATGVVHHIPLCLEIHHGSYSQFVLHFYRHMFHLSRTTAKPDTWQHPGGHKYINNTLFLDVSYTVNLSS